MQNVRDLMSCAIDPEIGATLVKADKMIPLSEDIFSTNSDDSSKEMSHYIRNMRVAV
jgi:hypothetical protein